VVDGNFRIKLEGLDTLQELLERAGDQATPMLAQALVAEMQLVFRESQRRVPVGVTGNLKSSGRVKPPVVTANTVTVTLGYGGAARKYAAVVHQLPRMGINWTKPGTGSHFLADPLNEKLPDIERAIRDRLERMLST
jgi:hypothetical protein